MIDLDPHLGENCGCFWVIETFGYSKTFPILENKPEETSGDLGVGWGVGGAFQMQRPLLVYKACHLDSNKYVYMYVRLHTEELGVEG